MGKTLRQGYRQVPETNRAAVSGTQLTFDLEPGLVERHDTLLACLRECVYTHRNPIKTIAADMDTSPSTLSRKLAGDPNDPRHFTVDDLESYVRATGDVTPIRYLAAKWLRTDEQKERAAIAELAALAPKIAALLKQVNQGT